METTKKVEYVRENVVLDCESPANSFVHHDSYRYVNCTIEELRIDLPITSLTLKGCEISKLIIDFVQLESIHIMECSIEDIQITSDLKPEVIFFDEEMKWEGKVIGKLFISQKTSVQSLTITSTAIHYFVIDNSTIQNFDSEMCFCEHLKMNLVTSLNVMEFKECKFYRHVDVANSTLSKLTFANCKMDRLSIRNNLIEEINIECERAKEVSLYDNKSTKLTIQGDEFEDLSIVLGAYSKMAFYSKNIKKLFVGSGYRHNSEAKLEVGLLDFSHYYKNHSTRVRINDIIVGKLDLMDFDNLGGFELLNAHIGDCRMAKTNLGSAVFNNVSVKRFEIINSIISASRFTNIVWPKGHLIYEFDEEGKKGKIIQSKKELYIKLAESYRQLKLICLSGNDKYNALAFHRNEMNHIWNAADIDRRDNIGNWLILGSDKLFSDFGQSLKKPLIWLFTFHTILFVTLLLSFDLPVEITFDPSRISVDAFWEGFGVYLNLLSPVHGGIIKGENIFGVTDFLMRLSSGYFIYYFIRVTRKFNGSVK